MKLRTAGVTTILVALVTIYGQSNSDRNTIRGIVVWKEDHLGQSVAHPIEDAYAVAFDSANKPLSRSRPTESDGKFSLVVPDSIKEFRLLIHHKQVRFWDYKPDDPVSNTDHPHDIGQIVLNDRHELSENEANSQAEAASLLNVIDATAAALLLNRAAKAYLAQYEPERLACPDPSLANQIQVKYRTYGEMTETSNGADGRLIMNAKLAYDSLRSLGPREEEFFKSHGFYATLDQMLSSKLAQFGEFEPPGYCIELYTGILKGRSFEMLPTPHPNYYVLSALPHAPGKSGNIVLHTDPSGIVRYSETGKVLKRLEDALPVAPDFPLGMIRQVQTKSDNQARKIELPNFPSFTAALY